MNKKVNPLLPLDEFIPDVEARVFTGSDGRERVFLYGSHDNVDNETWCSHQYHVYSAPVDDLGNWTDHGVTFASRSGEGYCWNGETDGVSWTDNRLYAPDVLLIDGRYWLVSCFEGGGLGMSWSDRPEGPFSPAVQIRYDDGEALPSIDPALYAEDGKVYLLWGQSARWAEGLVGVELEKDESGVYCVAMRASKRYLFGDERNPDQGFGFYEGPSIRRLRELLCALPVQQGQGRAHDVIRHGGRAARAVHLRRQHTRQRWLRPHERQRPRLALRNQRQAIPVLSPGIRKQQHAPQGLRGGAAHGR